jgi:hypothetical protein
MLTDAMKHRQVDAQLVQGIGAADRRYAADNTGDLHEPEGAPRGGGVVSVWVHCRKVGDGSRFPAEMIDVYWTASFDIPADLRYARCKCMRPQAATSA